MHDALIGELTTLIIRCCDADQLLREHCCTKHGKCASCKTGTYDHGPWPCTTYKAAARARELVAASRAPEMRAAG